MRKVFFKQINSSYALGRGAPLGGSFLGKVLAKTKQDPETQQEGASTSPNHISARLDKYTQCVHSGLWGLP